MLPALPEAEIERLAEIAAFGGAARDTGNRIDAIEQGLFEIIDALPISKRKKQELFRTTFNEIQQRSVAIISGRLGL